MQGIKVREEEDNLTPGVDMQSVVSCEAGAGGHAHPAPDQQGLLLRGHHAPPRHGQGEEAEGKPGEEGLGANKI